MIPAAALGIEPAAVGEGFEQRGLAAPVFADEKGDLAAKRQFDPVRERADVEGIGGWVDFLWQARNSVEERRACGPCRRSYPPSRCHRSTMPLNQATQPGHGHFTRVARSRSVAVHERARISGDLR